MLSIQKEKILIISPHPDDEVIGCGGLISKAREVKADVHVLYMCTGKTRQFVTGKTNSKIRENEIKAVSEYGSFNYSILFKNKYFVKLDTLPQKEIIDPIEDLIESYKPSIIAIPFGDSYNQDHRATFTACITALRPLPKTVRHFVDKVLIYEEPYNWTINNNFKPNFYIDTTEVENHKIELMKLHKSQNRDGSFARSPENLLNRMRLRGSEVGILSAEAYVLLRGLF